MSVEADAMRFLAAVHRGVRGFIGAGRTIAVSEAMRAAEVPDEDIEAVLAFALSNYWVDALARLPAINRHPVDPVRRDDHVWLTAIGEDLARTTWGDAT